MKQKKGSQLMVKAIELCHGTLFIAYMLEEIDDNTPFDIYW